MCIRDSYEGAHRFAVELAHRGISPGDVVSLMLPTSPEFFFAFAGTLLAGAIPAPIYPPIRADRIEEYADRQSAILSNAQAKLLVTFREAAGVARLLQMCIRDSCVGGRQTALHPDPRCFQKSLAGMRPRPRAGWPRARATPAVRGAQGKDSHRPARKNAAAPPASPVACRSVDSIRSLPQFRNRAVRFSCPR